MDGFYTSPPPELPGNIFSHLLNRPRCDSARVRKASASNKEVVSTVADVFQRTLELPALPQEDCHFFLAGGDSLLATRLLVELNACFPELAEQKARLSLGDLLAFPGISELAALIGKKIPLQTTSNET